MLLNLLSKKSWQVQFNVYYINRGVKGVQYLILDSGLYQFNNEEMVFTFKSNKFDQMDFNMMGTDVELRKNPDEMREELQDEVLQIVKAAL